MKKPFLFYFGFFWIVACVQGQTRGLFVPTTNGQTEPASQEKRVALVMGNQTYSGGGWGKLKNPVNDATLMASTLRNVGFEVISVSNGTKEQMLAGVNQLVQKISGKQTVALVFYAGHGVEAEQKNWIVPVNDATACRDEIPMNCISLDFIHTKLRNAGAAFNLLISDACRNNTLPFRCASSGRDGSHTGFIEFKAKGSCIAFSTAPNATASDGSGSNSPYTAALARAIAQEGLQIEGVFKQVARELDQLGQEPWVHNAFSGEFYFKLPVTPVVVTPTVQPTPAYQPPAPRVEPAPAPSVAKRDFTESSTGASFSMKFISGNSFSMGSNEGGDDEKPVHTVRVSDFHMAKYEVTVGEYLKFCEATNSNWPEWLEKGSSYHLETGTGDNKVYYYNKGYRRQGSENLPIVGVSWDNAVTYCKWLSSTTGKTYRLPTEAEWEYSARGGSNAKYAGSDNLDGTAWHVGNSDSKPHPVGQKQANGYGLYDMSGNVWEWCADWYGSNFYSNAAATAVNPAGAATGSYRVLRGGSWYDDGSGCRVATRSGYTPAYRNGDCGFRVVAFP